MYTVSGKTLGSHDWAQMAGHGMLLQNEGALLQFYKMEWNLL